MYITANNLYTILSTDFNKSSTENSNHPVKHHLLKDPPILLFSFYPAFSQVH